MTNKSTNNTDHINGSNDLEDNITIRKPENNEPLSQSKSESDLSNIFVIMEKLQNAVNNAKSLEMLTIFESQLEETLLSIREKRNILSRKSEEQKCVICLDLPASMICIPCGHICVCESMFNFFYLFLV